MGYFPFFIELKGKRGIIIGGGRIAKHKIEKVLPFEPELTVIAPEILLSILEMPEVSCKQRAFLESDLEGAAFVIAASDDDEVNALAGRLCRKRGILVNVVDDKEKCGFLFPALVKEGALTVGISTEGASPQVAASLRSRIAEELPDRMEEMLDYLAALRPTAKKQIADGKKRAAFLKEMALYCMETNRIPDEDETQAKLLEYSGAPEGECGEEASRKSGNAMAVPEAASNAALKLPGVTLTGAGCGAYDLITIRGLNALRKAEVLIYDDLIDTRLLDHVPESCEKIYVGKRNGRRSMKQEEINALLTEKAKTGKRVVRLKGGDPFVFGRGGEEMLALKENKIPVSEIPGITSAIAVPAAAGIPVTHRGVSRSFHVITGHTAGTADGLPEKWETLAALEGTCIFLMGVEQLPKIAEKLLEHGKNPMTPAAVIHGGFDGATDSVRGNLKHIAALVQTSAIESPAVIVIGETAGMELG